MFEDVFSDWREAVGTSARVESDLDRGLWDRLTALGVCDLTATQGAGATWVESAALLRAAARHAAPVPLAEHDLLAGWLAGRAGLTADGVRTACIIDADGRARRVPWASQVDTIVVVQAQRHGVRVAAVPRAAAQVRAQRDLAGQPRDDVWVEPSRSVNVEVGASILEEYRLRGALARAAQMTGAMGAAVELAAAYASQRVQFGRRLSQFQDVQRLVVDAAAECTLATTAVDAAVAAVADPATDPGALFLPVAAAASTAAHATSVVVCNTHQVHGAIGTTIEHRLHLVTRPLLAWRGEFGGARYWDERIARHVVESDQTAWATGVAG